MDEHGLLGGAYHPEDSVPALTFPQSTTDFPQACQALLEQVLAAGVLTDKSQSIRVLDVGCGCGDQSLYLAGLQRGVSSSAGPEFETTALRHRSTGSPLIDTYVGITLEPAQAALAKSRVHDESSVQISADVFCADASDPTSWSGDLLDSMTEMAASEDIDTSTWLLALDTMYHFCPSRLPLLRQVRSRQWISRPGQEWWSQLRKLRYVLCLKLIW